MKSMRFSQFLLIFLAAFYFSGCSQKNITSMQIPSEESEIKYVEADPEIDGSLWPGENSRNMLFVDSKARRVGDIVTILISENSNATKTATTDTSKDSSVNMSASGLLGLPSNLGITNLFGLGNAFDPNMSTSNSNEFKGAGTTTRRDTFTATLAATIIGILPNGNMRVEGTRKVSLNREDQDLTLTGIIRPEDIAFDNTIGSALIANAKITYSGTGVLADKQRVGWGTRFLDMIWPF